MTARLQALSNDLDKTRADLAMANRRLEADTEARFEQLERTVADVEAAQRRASGAADPWDVENLLRIANDSLNLAYDSNTAINALRRADARLAAIDDPAYAETRRQLAQEIAALEAMPKLDVSGLANELAALGNRLETIGVDHPRAAPAPAKPQGAAAAEGGEASGWGAMLRAWWNSLKSLISIKRINEPPVLAPDQRAALLLNLSEKLEAARIALLLRDNANYHASLQSAREWLVRYYGREESSVADIVGRLDELDRLDITPRMPDISGSLQALRAALDRRRGGRETGAPSAPTPPRQPFTLPPPP